MGPDTENKAESKAEGGTSPYLVTSNVPLDRMEPWNPYRGYAAGTLGDKVRLAVGRIQKVAQLGAIYVGHSGGKDSDAVMRLTEMATGPYSQHLVVHTMKDIVPLEDRGHLADKMARKDSPGANRMFMVPASDMQDFIRSTQVVAQVDGTRRDEFSRTDGRSTNLIVDGVEQSREEMTDFTKEGLFGIAFCFPIYDWSEVEVYKFLAVEGVQISPSYYAT